MRRQTHDSLIIAPNLNYLGSLLIVYQCAYSIELSELRISQQYPFPLQDELQRPILGLLAQFRAILRYLIALNVILGANKHIGADQNESAVNRKLAALIQVSAHSTLQSLPQNTSR